MNVSIFIYRESKEWVEQIQNSSVSELNAFRKLIRDTYNTGYIKAAIPKDIILLQNIGNLISTNDVEDIMKKKTLDWIKGDIGRICNKYNLVAENQ